MTSFIDPTKPTQTVALTADVRANFAAAKSEIEALQAFAGGGPYLPQSGGTVSAPGNSPLNVINPSMAYLPGVSPPNQIFRQIYAQQGNETTERQFSYIYPNSNRSHAGIITAALTIPASGQPSGQVARTQSPIFGTVVNYEPGANVGGIGATLNAIAAVPNGLAYGLNTQVIDTITPNDATANLLQTNVRLQNEYDYFVHNASTTVRGSLMLLYATVKASTGSNLVAYGAGILGGTSEIWGVSYQSANGGAYVGMQVGNTAPPAAQISGLSSQPIQLIYTDGTVSTNRFAGLTAVPAADGINGDLLLSTTSGRFGLKLANLAPLKGVSSAGADLTMAYVNSSNILVLGDGIGQTWIKGSNGNALECLTIGTAVNDVRISAVANGSAPIIASNKAAGGTDTNIGLWVRAFGAGALFLQAGVTGPLQVGAGVFTPNATTAVSLTAVAPAGAHATVQEWFTVTNSSGVVRYIPAF